MHATTSEDPFAISIPVPQCESSQPPSIRSISTTSSPEHSTQNRPVRLSCVCVAALRQVNFAKALKKNNIKRMS